VPLVCSVTWRSSRLVPPTLNRLNGAKDAGLAAALPALRKSDVLRREPEAPGAGHLLHPLPVDHGQAYGQVAPSPVESRP
jgi:hypothetical protein